MQLMWPHNSVTNAQPQCIRAKHTGRRITKKKLYAPPGKWKKINLMQSLELEEPKRKQTVNKSAQAKLW